MKFTNFDRIIRFIWFVWVLIMALIFFSTPRPEVYSRLENLWQEIINKK